jgi:hypothetical protein
MARWHSGNEGLVRAFFELSILFFLDLFVQAGRGDCHFINFEHLLLFTHQSINIYSVAIQRKARERRHARNPNRIGVKALHCYPGIVMMMLFRKQSQQEDNFF